MPACCWMAILQDPPELIEEFVALWSEGYDVVYGRRVKRDAPLLMQLAYKASTAFLTIFLLSGSRTMRAIFR